MTLNIPNKRRYERRRPLTYGAPYCIIWSMLGVSRDGRRGCHAIGLTAGESRLSSRQVQENVSFPRRPDRFRGPNHSYPMVKRGSLSPSVKRPEVEADYSPFFSADSKTPWAIDSLPIRLLSVVPN